MRKLALPALLLALGLMVFVPTTDAQRGRGGGGGYRGGGVPRGGSVGGYRGGAVHSYGAGSYGARPSHPIAGPGYGVSGGRGGGTVTTPGGSTVRYGGAAVGGTGPGGVTRGRAVGGVQVTTPGGREVTKVGRAAGATGPGGRTVGGRTGTTVGTGPGGSMASRYRGGVAIGPGGAVAGGSRAGVASGGYGAVAGRSTVVAGRGTVYRSRAAISNQGVYVRRSVSTYPCFRAGWYRSHPGAWFAAGWAAGAVWRSASWGTCASYCGITEEPVSYSYGDSVVYQSDGVYMDGERVASAEVYAEQATGFADTGREAEVKKDEEWLPLGVFAMAQGEEKTSNHIFQLAVNKKGVIRGNYYDAVTDTTKPVYGSVDKKSQRAAWTVGDSKTPVYEAGISNLTRAVTTIMVHYGKERSAQFMLVRVEDPEAKE